MRADLSVLIRPAGLLLGAVLLAGGLSAGARAALGKLAGASAFAVRELEVRGNARAGTEEILRLAGIEPGDSWLALPEESVRSRVRSHPWVAEVRLRRPWPGKVRLLIRERVPVARVRIGAKDYGLDSSLCILPRVGQEVASLPLVRVRGAPAGPRLDEEGWRRALAYVEALGAFGLTPRESVELQLSPRGEDRILLSRRGVVVRVEGPVTPRQAVRNAAAFLAAPGAKGRSRGTLRLITEGTGVWEPQGRG